MFWSALLWLIGITLIIHFVFPFLLMPGTGLLMMLTKRMEQNPDSGPILLFYIGAGINYIYSMYLITAWAAYCAYKVVYFVNAPIVEYTWIYYGMGFIACYGLLGSMAVKEGSEIGFATMTGIFLGAISFIVFLIWPTLINPLHWWWLRLVA